MYGLWISGATDYTQEYDPESGYGEEQCRDDPFFGQYCDVIPFDKFRPGNSRVKEKTTYYYDQEDSTGAPVYVKQINNAWDGYHYRQTIIESNLLDNPVITAKKYSPDIENRIIDKYTASATMQGEKMSITEYVFNAEGRLVQETRKANPDPEASGLADLLPTNNPAILDGCYDIYGDSNETVYNDCLNGDCFGKPGQAVYESCVALHEQNSKFVPVTTYGAQDVVTDYEYYADGKVKSTTVSGGEDTKSYTSVFTYEYGTKKTEKSPTAPFYDVNRTIDETGLILSEEDASGFKTFYQHDDMSRVTAVIPETTATTGVTEQPTYVSYPDIHTTVVTIGNGAPRRFRICSRKSCGCYSVR